MIKLRLFGYIVYSRYPQLYTGWTNSLLSFESLAVSAREGVGGLGGKKQEQGRQVGILWHGVTHEAGTAVCVRENPKNLKLGAEVRDEESTHPQSRFDRPRKYREQENIHRIRESDREQVGLFTRMRPAILNVPTRSLNRFLHKVLHPHSHEILIV